MQGLRTFATSACETRLLHWIFTSVLRLSLHVAIWRLRQETPNCRRKSLLGVACCPWTLPCQCVLHVSCSRSFGARNRKVFDCPGTSFVAGSRALAYFADKKNEDHDEEDCLKLYKVFCDCIEIACLQSLFNSVGFQPTA